MSTPDSYTCPDSAHFWKSLGVPHDNVMILEVKPMGKPRMTRADAWKDRPAVLRWYEYKREVFFSAAYSPLVLPPSPVFVAWLAYLPMPKSWPESKQLEKAFTYHDAKPDKDNIEKGLLDILFTEDKGIAAGSSVKRWAPRGAPGWLEIFAK